MLECTRRRFPTRRGPRDAAPRPQGALSTRFQSTAKELGNSASYLPFDGLRQAHRYPVGHGGIAGSGGAHPPLIAGLAHRYPADIGGIVGPRFGRLGRTKCLLLKKRSKRPIMLNGRGCRPTRRVHGCASPGGIRGDGLPGEERPRASSSRSIGATRVATSRRSGTRSRDVAVAAREPDAPIRRAEYPPSGPSGGISPSGIAPHPGKRGVIRAPGAMRVE